MVKSLYRKVIGMDKVKQNLVSFMDKYSDRCSFVLFISKIAFFIVLLLFMILAGSYSLGKPLLYFNTTDSTTRGIYVVSLSNTYEYDDFYVVRLNQTYNNLKQGQLLLKQIKGKPGDIYISRYDHMDLNGVRYNISNDKRLPHMLYGSYMVPDEHYLMLNMTEDSFDGRYMGPTKKEHLVQKVWLLVNYDKIIQYQKYVRNIICSIFPFLEDKLRVGESVS